MIRIELDGCDTAICGDLSVTSAKAPICKLARKLVNAGHDAGQEVGVFRGEAECFRRVPLSAWAGMSISENNGTSVRFARYTPDPRF